MSVNRISQSHSTESQAVQNVNSQKSPASATKAHAVDGQDARKQVEPAAQSQPAATTGHPAGQEQGREQNTGNDTNGTRVNVFA